jgi:hypothetical protein
MKLEIFVNIIVYLLKINAIIKKMLILNFSNLINNSHFFESSYNTILYKFIKPYKTIYDFGNKTEHINYKLSNNKEIWYFITGRNDNKNIANQVCISIESVFNKQCNLLCNKNLNETTELLEAFIQSFYPIKTKFIYYCTEEIKKKIFNNTINKVVLIVKTDETLLLSNILNHLSSDQNIKPKELKKIEYFYFNENEHRNLCQI